MSEPKKKPELPKRPDEAPFDAKEAYEIPWAIKHLAEAMGARVLYEASINIRRAQKNLEEYMNKVQPIPDLNEDECDLSAGLHTYMRKGMVDHPLAGIMWSLIDERRGFGIWLAFVKGIMKVKSEVPANRKYQHALRFAEEFKHNGTPATDDYIMFHCLEMFEEHFPEALDWLGIKSNEPSKKK